MDSETPDLGIYDTAPNDCKWCGGHIRNCPFCREDKTLRNPDGTVLKFITMYVTELAGGAHALD